jgi:hypothetical protein
VNGICSGCHFAEAKDRPDGGPADRFYCHRFPPQVVMHPHHVVPHHFWPQVKETGWCGEFKQREENNGR